LEKIKRNIKDTNVWLPITIRIKNKNKLNWVTIRQIKINQTNRNNQFTMIFGLSQHLFSELDMGQVL